MNRLTMDSLTHLLKQQSEVAVTIYCPTHPSSAPNLMRENLTRFKSLIQRVSQQLSNSEVDTATSKKIIEMLETMINDRDVWKQTAESMVVFANPKTVEVFAIPMETEERIVVGDRFDVAPLLALSTYDQQYLLLALAVHEPKLFRGSMYGLEPVDIEFPKSPEDALNIDEMFSNSKTIRFGSGGIGTNPHGQGDSREAGTEERLKYFRIIDNLIMESPMYDSTLPVLIAGTTSEIAEYRDISNIPNILDAHIDGNHTKSSLSDLHERAWPILSEEMQNAKQDELLHKYDYMVGAEKASQDLNEIQEATTSGRVDTLLLGLISTSVNTIRDSKPFAKSIRKIVFPIDYDYRKISNLAIDVLKQGGSVVGIFADKLPKRVDVLALYRY